MKRITILSIMIVACLILVGCGGNSGPVVGDPENGEALYNQPILGTKSSAGCVTCHRYDSSKGDNFDTPYTAGTASRAAEAFPGLSAEEYILESIVDPDIYITERYSAGTMYAGWEEDLSEQELADIVAYLLTEK